jgi:hypothetical protein
MRSFAVWKQLWLAEGIAGTIGGGDCGAFETEFDAADSDDATFALDFMVIG